MIEIQGYTILGQVGKGGMASVYRARQVLLDREVALKVMSPQLATDPAYAQRFLQEARMLAALNHPNIVQVYDIGETPAGLIYFSMQLLTGGDFAARMREGLSEVELIRVLVAVAQALGFAHQRSYVHRDVTPANIMFDGHGLPVLTDFGIARALSSNSRITSAGLSIGTSQYMSPEQARGVEVDHRSDIYSLGVLTFEALAGHAPYEGDDGFAVAFSHVHDPVPRLPEEAARWQPLVDAAMAKNPSERIADCAAFVAALAEIAPEEYAEAIGALPATPSMPAARSGPATARAVAAPAAGRRVGSASVAKPFYASWWDALRETLSQLPRWAPPALGAAALVFLGLLGLGLWQWLSPAKTGATPPGPPVAAAIRPAATTGPSRPDPAPALPSEAPASEDEPAPGALIDPVAAAQSGEPLTLPSVEDPVVQLLGLAAANIRSQRYTTPPVTNALDRYRLVLQIEPDNTDALQGIARLAAIYLEIAGGIDRDQDLAGWLDNLARAEQVAGESSAAREIAASVVSLRNGYFETLLQRARKAIDDWNRDAARVALQRAEQVRGGDPVVAGLREAAEHVGTTGYVFRHGKTLPEMVVVGERLALARSEISVTEFKRYWSEAGKARFGNALPSCRNRESVTLFSRRSFEAPDIPQDANHPVVCVSFDMAQHYAEHIAARSGKPYRLPKAGELAGLMAAADPGCGQNVRDDAYQREYRGRGHLGCSDGHAATAPVRSFAAVAPGLFDLDGNVSEWTSDCVDQRCSERLVMGRSWALESNRSARRGFPADAASNTIGIRLALDLPVRASAAP